MGNPLPVGVFSEYTGKWLLYRMRRIPVARQPQPRFEVLACRPCCELDSPSGCLLMRQLYFAVLLCGPRYGSGRGYVAEARKPRFPPLVFVHEAAESRAGNQRRSFMCDELIQ